MARLSIILTGLWLAAASPLAAATLIVNASLIDGTGAAARAAAVRIDGDRIVAVGDLAPAAGDTVIDAHGLTLTPGFIDTHSHHDLEGFKDRASPELLAQGVTTIVIGNDGFNATPLKDFERYIVDEVPALALASIPAVSQSSPLFIAGLSMGGFGALRLGAKYPDRFGAISAHSSITHFDQMPMFVEEPLARYGPVPHEDQSVIHWMRANAGRLPPLRFDCGINDQLVEANRVLHADLNSAGIAHQYEEFPGGHEWPYWERHVEDSLHFFGRHALAGREPVKSSASS